ncbi:hypothetical protein HYV49_02620 [Candidatus Pacearchaeota archaeon]|nr:hypothetical protein [Candidatus Pacearchaeota archaeon]
MKTIQIVKPSRFLKNKKELEKNLGVNMTIKRSMIEIKGEETNEYIAEKVIEAVNYGFALKEAYLLKDPEYTMQKLNIKDITKKHNLKLIRARIIGKEGKSLRTITNLADCVVKLINNTIILIGRVDEIENAIQAFTSLINGAKHSKVYSRLERMKSKKKMKDDEDIDLLVEK